MFLVLLVQIPQGENRIGLASLQMRPPKLMFCLEWATSAMGQPFHAHWLPGHFALCTYHMGEGNEAGSFQENLVVKEGWGAGTIKYFQDF